MRIVTAALGLSSCLAIIAGSSLAATPAAADPASANYVVCNQYNECWRVHHRYAYPGDQKMTYHDGDWYNAHQQDAQWHWLNDPSDDRGYYDRDANWRADPGARLIAGGAAGAGIGAAIGCVVTLPIGCAPGAAVGAAIGGGTGAVAGVATTPR